MRVLISRLYITILFVCLSGNFACDQCQWESWGSWSPCPCGTHGITTSRLREMQCRDAIHVYDCGYNDVTRYESETTVCEFYCSKQGRPNNGHCECFDRFHGTCCEQSEY